MPLGQKDPDIFITLEVLGDATDVGLYCNPGWGQYADVNANYPQPGYAIWQSGVLLYLCRLLRTVLFFRSADSVYVHILLQVL